MRGCQACDWGRVVDEQGRTTWTSCRVPAGVSGCVAQAGGDDKLEVGEQGWVTGLEGCAYSWLHTGSPLTDCPPPQPLSSSLFL